MTEEDHAFHTSVKPSWATDNTLVYSIPGSTPPVDGNMTTAKQSIVSEGKDVRFATFVAPNANTTSLQLQMNQSTVSIVDGTPAAKTPEVITFATLAEDVARTTASDKHERAVWKVASILFDPVSVSCAALTQGLSDMEIAELEHRIRRDALSEYWTELVHEDSARAARDAATAEEKAFALLTGNDLEAACAALVDGNDLRLATIIAQLPGNGTMKEMMRKQIDSWRSQNVLSEISEPIRALYEVAAGNVGIIQGKTGATEDRATTFGISSRFGLDWRRSFGLRLWFGANASDSLSDAVLAYENDVASKTETVRPVPFFTEQGVTPAWDDSASQSREDTLFGLLKLYAREPGSAVSSVTDLLSPTSVSGNPLDARLAWQLSALLRSKQIVSPADVSDETFDTLTLALAAQLEANSELSGALKALLHLSTSTARETHIRSMLYRRAQALSAASSPDTLPSTLTDNLKLPAQWLWHARALYARSVEENHIAEATYLLRAEEYDEAHTVLCRTVGPHAVITQDSDSLRELLGGFEGLSDEVRIEGWEVGGQVYFDYVYLLDMGGKHMAEKKVVLDRLVRALPGMLAVRHKERVDLEERVAVSLISSAVKAECEKIGRDEKVSLAMDLTATQSFDTNYSPQGIDAGKLRSLPTAGDEYAMDGVKRCNDFYNAIAV